MFGVRSVRERAVRRGPGPAGQGAAGDPAAAAAAAAAAAGEAGTAAGSAGGGAWRAAVTVSVVTGGDHAQCVHVR
jgi:hypothetical protein